MHIKFACFYFALILGTKTITTFIHSRSSLENQIPVFWAKRRKNPSRWGGTYLHSLYKGAPSPPPPQLGGGLAFDTRKTAFFGLLRTSAPQISEIIFLYRIDLIAKKALEWHCKPLVDLSEIGTSLIGYCQQPHRRSVNGDSAYSNKHQECDTCFVTSSNIMLLL